MRGDHGRLTDMLAAARAVQEHVAGKTRSEVEQQRSLQSAILFELFVLGEAATRVSQSLKKKHPEVPWADICGFRNKLAHEYFALDWDLVWETVRSDIPLLQQQLEAIVASEL